MTERNPTPPGLNTSPSQTTTTISLEGNNTSSKPLTTVCQNSNKPTSKLTISVFDSMHKVKNK